MAEVITKFKVDTSQFDSKVKGAKKNLDDFSKSGKGLSSGLNSLSSALGTNITKYASWAAALSAAMKVMKDAIKSTESGIDELGRCTEGAKGAYKSFLSTLNGGNWSNFFNNLSTAVQGARDLYDSLDRLGSVKSNNSAAIAIEQQAIQALRLRQQKGENVSAEMAQHTAALNALQMQAVDAGKTAGRDKIAYAISTIAGGLGGGAMFNNSSLNEAIDRILNEGQSAFDYYAGQLNELKKRGTKSVDTSYVTQDGIVINGKENRFDINNLTSGQQAMYKLAYAITEGETSIQEGIGIFATAINEQAAASKELLKGNKYSLHGVGGGGGTNSSAPAGSIAEIESRIKDVSNEWKQATDQITRDELGSYLEYLNQQLERMKGNVKDFGIHSKISFGESVDGAKILDDGLAKVKDRLDAADTANNAKKTSDGWMSAVSAIGQFAGAIEGLEDPAAKVAGIVAQAIANIALGFGAAAANEGKSGNMWDWIAASITGAATMVSTIAAVKQATKGYAQGGIVGSLGYGMSSSGDNIVARLNKGEGVLTRAGIDNAESLFNGGIIGGLHLEASISGEDLRLALVNNSRRRGGSRGGFAYSK